MSGATLELLLVVGAKGQGSEPKWNKVFSFTVSGDDTSDIIIKIMDSDYMSEDDFVGKPDSYVLTYTTAEYKGEIKVGLTLINPAEETEKLLNEQEEDYGGELD
ncbi:hypothetical protein FRX31_017670 [Thalictrum thalictroides]|uniref:C2 domain-containing protein n=1 Tax=Thalictrum thalictroides TaxID=46969 RepID=A0A7J6W6A0_THATH|nr:hypothetical protein FRX31_017670 [Thalictrum thalictroides]